MKRRRLIVSLLLIAMMLSSFSAPIAAFANTVGGTTVSNEKTDAMEAIEAAFSDYKTHDTVSISDDGYIGIPVELTVYYDPAKGSVVSGVRGTPVILYVVNTCIERIGTDSDVTIISDLLSRGYVVCVLDYLNSDKAVSPDLEWSTQSVRNHTILGEFFDGNIISNAATYNEVYVLPAGYNVTNDLVYWEIDKHGADGTLEKIVEIWNNDFRGTKGEKVIYWLDDEGNKKPTQNALDGTAPVWVDESHIKIKYTKAETIYDCVKADGSFIDLNLYMQIIYPTNPEKEVPVMCLASSAENAIRAWTKDTRCHLSAFLFNGYAGVLYDYGYTPMAREDHYAYFDGNAAKGYITGDNQTYSIDVYNEKKTNTAALRLVRYLADTQGETYSFDVDAIGIMGHSKAGVVTFMGAEHPELLSETRFFPGHHGETRYENGYTEDDEIGFIDGAEEQPWLTYSNGESISSRANFVYASAGSRSELINYGHSPTYLVGTMLDVAFYSFYPTIQNQCETYDVPCLYFRVENLAHDMAIGEDKDHGVDTFAMMEKFASYYLKGDAAECVWITPFDRTTEVSTTADITVKFTGVISAEQIEKVAIVSTATGKAASGVWTSSFGGTEWTFKPDRLEGGVIYRVTVPTSIIDVNNGLPLAEEKEILFRTDYEKISAPTVSSGELVLRNTEGDANGVYYLFEKDTRSDSFKFSFNVVSDAHNIVNVYAITDINADELAASTLSVTPIATVNLSGRGAYTVDVTDYVSSASGDYVGFYLELNRAEGEICDYNKDFEDVTAGEYKLPKALYYVSYCDGIISDDMGSNSLLIRQILHNGDRVSGGTAYTPTYVNNTFYENPRPALTIGGTFGASITEEDYGKTFRFSIRVYDTTSRLVQFKVGELSVKDNLELADYKPMAFGFYTKAGEWTTYEFEFTLDNPDYWNGLNKNKVTMIISSTGDLDCPMYVDDIKMTEIVTAAQIGDAYLVSYPTETNVFEATEMVSFDANGEKLESSSVSGEKLSYATGATKLYVKYPLAQLSDRAESNAASFHIAASKAGKITVYGVSDTSDWNGDSLNYFNAIANDRFSSGVNSEKVYGGAPLATIEVNGTNVYSVDISEYAEAMKDAGAKNITLILTTDSDAEFAVSPISGTVTLYKNYEDGKTNRFPDTKVNGTSTGTPEYCNYNYVIRSSATYPVITESPEGNLFGDSSLALSFNGSAGAIKFFNMFGKNLTEEDLGDTYTITLRLTTDAESFFVRYGFMSATAHYAAPYTGDKLYNPLTDKASSGNKELMVELHKDEWTTVSFTFPITEKMLGSYTDENGNTVHNNQYFTYDGKEYTVHCNYALFAMLALTPDSGVKVYIDDFLVTKAPEKVSTESEYGVVASWDYNNMATLKTWPNTKVNNISTGIDEYSESYNTVVRSTSYPKLSDEDRSGNGKSLMMTMDNKNAYVKLLNTFGKNLTEDDLGDTYKITFYAKADIDELKFHYGFCSSTTEYVAPSTGDKHYNPALDTTKGITVTVGKEWKKITYTFKITEKMLASYTDANGQTVSNNWTFDYNGQTYTVHCNYALFSFRANFDSFTAGGEYVNSHLYIDDLTVERTDENGNVPKNGINEMAYGDFASISSDGKISAGNIGNVSDPTAAFDAISSYVTFSKGNFIDAEKATLKLNVGNAAGATFSVYGINSPDVYNGILTLDKTYGGKALDTAVAANDGSVVFNVTDYVKANRDIGYGFVLVSEIAGGINYITAELAQLVLTPSVDYFALPSTTVTAEENGLGVSGNGVVLYNIFGEGNALIGIGEHTVKLNVVNNSAKAGSYTLSLCDKDGNTVGNALDFALNAGENKEIAMTVVSTPETVELGACAVKIAVESEADITLASIKAYSENSYSVDGNATLNIELPYVCTHIYDDEYDADCNNCGEIREVEIPVTVVAEGKCGVNTTWVLTSDGVLTVSGNGDTEDYLVSITTEQPYRAYQDQITKVVIEEGVTSIGRGAFYGFTNITEVVFPESLIAIHEYAFFGCTAIKTVTIPENTFYIGMYAFRKTGLTSISFANADGWTFADGTALDVTNVKAFTTEFTYKQTCMRPVYEDGEVIANGVFGNKDQFTWTLTSTGVLTISGKGNMPKFNVNTTPWYGYRGAIRSVVIEEGITSVGRCSFHTCRAITSVTLPESLETIAEYAFYNCQFLTEATIPANVTRIEIYAFRKCFALNNVEFAINYGWTAGDAKVSATELNSNAADMLTLVNYTKIWTRDVNAEEEVLDPNYVTGGACNTTIKWALTYIDDTKTKMKLTISGTGAMPKFETAGTPWYGYLNDIVEVEVCEGITEIGRCSFYGLKFVKVATIADTVTSINDYAFSGCFSLKSIEIPASVTYIAETAFTKTGVTL